MKKILAALFVTFAMTGAAFADTKLENKVSVDAPKEARTTSKSVVKVTVKPADGYHMNLDFPTKLTVKAPDGVTVEKAKISKKDNDKEVRVDASAAEFDVNFTATSAGKKDFTGEVRFAVCKDTECIPQSATVSFSIDVK